MHTATKLHARPLTLQQTRLVAVVIKGSGKSKGHSDNVINKLQWPFINITDPCNTNATTNISRESRKIFHWYYFLRCVIFSFQRLPTNNLFQSRTKTNLIANISCGEKNWHELLDIFPTRKACGWHFSIKIFIQNIHKT